MPVKLFPVTAPVLFWMTEKVLIRDERSVFWTTSVFAASISRTAYCAFCIPFFSMMTPFTEEASTPAFQAAQIPVPTFFIEFSLTVEVTLQDMVELFLIAAHSLDPVVQMVEISFLRTSVAEPNIIALSAILFNVL